MWTLFRPILPSDAVPLVMQATYVMGDVDDVVSSDNRKVHLPLGLVVLHLLRVAKDEVHVRVEPIEDSAIPPPAFQLNHHVRTDPLVEERKRLNHRTTAHPWRRRT